QLPPWSTLFPSTTLFRSGECPGGAAGAAPPGGGDWWRLGRNGDLDFSAVAGIGDVQGEPLGALFQVALVDQCPGDVGVFFAEVGDRKSTRLNSSHVKISY